MFRAKVNGDVDVKSIKIVGTGDIVGYKKVNEYFVDNSGLGDRGEPAYIFSDFLSQVKAGFYYSITRQGQFQVYVGEYVKVNTKEQLTELGIVSSKKVANNTRLTTYNDGRRVLTLHNTDIITWKSDGKIILTTGGWHTTTTKARLNEYLPTSVFVYQRNSIWYIGFRDTRPIIEFTDGIEIDA